jgi:hypothetical protein
MTTVSPSLTLHSWHGRRILALLCAVAFPGFVDASITNTHKDPNETHGAELQAGPPLAAAAPELIKKEIE